MNTYIVPVSSECRCDHDYRMLVHANSIKEAYSKVKELPEVKRFRWVSDNFNKYLCFDGQLKIPVKIFHKTEMDDIIKLLQDQSIKPESDGNNAMADLLHKARTLVTLVVR